MLADGNPIEIRMINKIGLERNGFSDETITALKQAHRIMFREQLSVSNALTKIEADVSLLPEVLYFINFVKSSERGISR